MRSVDVDIAIIASEIENLAIALPGHEADFLLESHEVPPADFALVLGAQWEHESYHVHWSGLDCMDRYLQACSFQIHRWRLIRLSLLR